MPTSSTKWADQACLFRRFLFDCDFINDVWATLDAVTAPWRVDLPTTLSGYLLLTPKTTSNIYQAATSGPCSTPVSGSTTFGVSERPRLPL
ncbi:hypothetical protein SPRG_12162 [Saprolegnia parasitica CBS 223.65]|uniref:Uncharacterized protein n=1 Tax=Saprolegnia parasitica (strain CBS 223.65) TaxID=695850 RepID=A0A067C0W5_SAPPC|nr:hypothetical protein SPRG_12162 [Saprolegnia parasitica CBS 223.65]KDO22735.1 hypothetical protein SPRG_12162 [Saprolegnia parasitica CBS 223.65]|eukprot:XP_012206523.1 hypothetical protein SPRG_12162 [Saprolegnia parasitica CBS 223.65]